MTKGPIELEIINNLNESMNITSLKIINESFMHNVPKDSESHFKVIIVRKIRTKFLSFSIRFKAFIVSPKIISSATIIVVVSKCYHK